MYAEQDAGTWASFEAKFAVESVDERRRERDRKKSRRHSESGSKSWMEHPVAATSSVAPLLPPQGVTPRGNAISMDRWSKHVQVKTSKSSSNRLVPKSPSAKSVSSVPTEIMMTRHHISSKKSEPIIMVEAPKKVSLENSRTTSSTASSSSDSDPAHKHRLTGEKMKLATSKLNINTSPSASRKQRSLHVRREESLPYEKQVITPQSKRHHRSHHDRRREKVSSENDRIPNASKGSSARDPQVEENQQHKKVASTRSQSNRTVNTEPGAIVRDSEVITKRSMVPLEIIQTTEEQRVSRSSSRARSKTSSGRGRSSSRPPKENMRSSSRTRSASLTRVTNIDTTTMDQKSRIYRPPPSTFRTQQEMRMKSSPAVRRRNRAGSDGDFHTSTNENTRIVSEIKFEKESEPNIGLKDSSTSKRGSLMEKLFGNHVEKPVQTRVTGSLGYEIRPRVLLAATVYHNTATSLWITTINTNQKGVAKNPATANKFLKAFSFSTEREARESAIANAPPKMVSFSDSQSCFICKGNFAVFRRAAHCRNCGVCICSGCSTSWPSKMLPATYNLKNEAQVRVCQSCNGLSLSFKKALLEGDFDDAVAIYNTGNINLRTPFPLASKKDELCWPVHCAVEGGNLCILRWLVDDHFCPIKYCTSSKKPRGTDGAESAITTSRGRSVLSIAIECQKVEIMRYLVVDCGVSVYDCKDLKAALRALEAALVALPHSVSHVPVRAVSMNAPLWDKASFDDVSEPSSLGADEHHDNWTLGSKSNRSKSSRTTGSDQCILCRCHVIDCVATPCGHQVCCLDCSTTLRACPICNEHANFIKVFRP